MSSHHIIREDQEPALIVDELAAVSEAYFQQLLEWSPTLLTGDDALPLLQDSGVKVDVWFTRHGMAEPPQDSTIVKPAGPVWMEAALTYLISRGQQAVNILSNRTNMRKLIHQYADRMNVVLLGNGQRTVMARPGFSKWKPQGETLWLYGEVVATHGLVHNEANTYTTQQDGFFSVTFAEPFGLVGERL